MTITQWKDYFDILQDKYGSPYFTDTEKSLLFNRAIIQFVKQYLPDESQENNIELSQDTLNDLEPVIHTLGELSMNSSGVIAKTAVTAALVAVRASSVLWRPLSVGWGVGSDYRAAKFVRHNDWYEFQNNFFKKPSSDNPKYRVDATNYIFAPVQPSARVFFTVLRYPVTVDIATVVNCDLPDHTHDKILSIALELAGISSRDEALAQLLQLRK